jgi:hypothetical protein
MGQVAKKSLIFFNCRPNRKLFHSFSTGVCETLITVGTQIITREKGKATTKRLQEEKILYPLREIRFFLL